MNVLLGSELEKLIVARVRSGRYATAEDVIRAGLASLEQQEGVESMSTSELEAVFPGFRQRIAEGMADEKAGRMSDGDAFFDELERENAH
ncbi:MAG TPA: type II toxin-antitoxin system ParD family antitoxin [Tepidisphaeraceae bacterium]|jgi:putative addiction module CopG family antidote|nr:type II toxin-antitoxin system ParD family antitoxin [Tepidisphaeraceae bacterium]